MGDATYEEMFGKIPYFGLNEVMRMSLAQVLTHIPESVREFVLEKCVITTSAEPLLGGVVWKAQIPKRALDSPHEFWLIVLSELVWSVGSGILRGQSLKDATKGQKERWKKATKKQNERWRHIIAHEIARAYLNHDRMNLELPEDTEAEANRLVAQWGFANPYARTPKLR